MGTIFDKLIGHFSGREQRGGRRTLHFRDVVKLMADLIFLPVNGSDFREQVFETAGYVMKVGPGRIIV